MKPGKRLHKCGLLQYLQDGKYKFEVVGFDDDRKTGANGWCRVASEDTQGNYVSRAARITKTNTVIYCGYRIPQSRWRH